MEQAAFQRAIQSRLLVKSREAALADYHCEVAISLINSFGPNTTIRRMAGKANESKALVIIRKTWIDEAGMGNILEQEHPHTLPSEVKFQVVRVTEYTLVDTWFLELEFYPKFLSGDLTAKLLVPKQEVLAVLQTEKPEHLVGFMVPQPPPLTGTNLG